MTPLTYALQTCIRSVKSLRKSIIVFLTGLFFISACTYDYADRQSHYWLGVTGALDSYQSKRQQWVFNPATKIFVASVKSPAAPINSRQALALNLSLARALKYEFHSVLRSESMLTPTQALEVAATNGAELLLVPHLGYLPIKYGSEANDANNHNHNHSESERKREGGGGEIYQAVASPRQISITIINVVTHEPIETAAIYGDSGWLTWTSDEALTDNIFMTYAQSLASVSTPRQHW